jgi:hypothetical protein
MGAIVTLAQADAHLRLNLSTSGSPPEYDDDRVSDVELKIAQAEAIVTDYLKAPDDALDGSPPNWSVSSPVLWSARDITVIQGAVLLVLSALYDDEMDRTLADYMRPNGAIPLMLARLRDPAIA